MSRSLNTPPDLSLLTPEQLVRRNALINTLHAHYLANSCCRRQPDWAAKLYRMTLESLEKRYVEIFRKRFAE